MVKYSFFSRTSEGDKGSLPVQVSFLTIAFAVTLGVSTSAKASSLSGISTTTELPPLTLNRLEGGGTSYTLTDPNYIFHATNPLVTSIPDNVTAGASVNTILGANAFYNNGITGQGAILAAVEAGHIWNGHETLTRVTNFSQNVKTFGGGLVSQLYDRHSTWVGQILGGSGSQNYQIGIAPGSDLRSGAIATNWTNNAYALGFNVNANTFNTSYNTYFGTANVINSSFNADNSTGTDFIAMALDGFAAANPTTTFVSSAGNGGRETNTVGSPASGYNGISVGALQNDGNNLYNTVADFSSRGPQDYNDPTNGTITGVRAGVDIVAPGTTLTAAYYGGQTGGNNPSLPGSPDGTEGGSDFYSNNLAGTSFSSPIVAGAATLLNSASLNTSALAGNILTRDSRVIKAVLLNSADKPTGWNNGKVINALGGVDTTQSLDYSSGAGSLNLNQAYENYVNASTRDLPGLAGGNIGATGFDYGSLSRLGTNNFYTINNILEGGTNFTATLNWFRDRSYDPETFTANDLGEADLNLYLVDLISGQRIASSSSIYNNTEHFSFILPTTSQYGLRVEWFGTLFGSPSQVGYGLAWRGTAIKPVPAAVPEPLTVAGGATGLILLALFKLRIKKKS